MLKSIFSSGEDLKRPHVEHALELKNVSVRYDGHLALEDVSLTIDMGLRVAVVGPNGAGKSTLFGLLAGLLQPSSGSVRIHDHAPAEHHCLAYVPQSSQVDWNFPISVRDVAMMGRVGRLGLFHWPHREDWQRVSQSLEQVQLSQLARRQISELSGGQKQRMFIARALAQEANLLLLDEPLAGLDVPSQEQILHILDDLKQQGITVLFATHDLSLASDHFDRIVLLNRRLVAYGEANEVLTAANLTTAYGGHMQAIETDQGKLLLGDSGGHVDHASEGHRG